MVFMSMHSREIHLLSQHVSDDYALHLQSGCFVWRDVFSFSGMHLFGILITHGKPESKATSARGHFHFSEQIKSLKKQI